MARRAKWLARGHVPFVGHFYQCGGIPLSLPWPVRETLRHPFALPVSTAGV
jgi:hypothetical protein